MTTQDALDLIYWIQHTPYGERVKKLSKADWDFTNSMASWAKSGRAITPKQAYRLNEVYRLTQSAYAKVYHERVG